MISTAYNMDCMAYMARLKDNAFDIAIGTYCGTEYK